MLLVFGLARSIPLLVGGAVTEKIKAVPRFALWIPKFERASGAMPLLAPSASFIRARSTAAW